MKIDLQLFGGRGGVSGLGSGGGEASAPVIEKKSVVSATSTGGKLVKMNTLNKQWRAEADDGASVSILFAGNNENNLGRYGNRIIYRVYRFDPNSKENLVTNEFSFNDAKKLANDYMNDHKKKK